MMLTMAAWHPMTVVSVVFLAALCAGCEKARADECDDSSNVATMWTRTNYTLTHFPVAGVNLAAYGMYKSPYRAAALPPPFQLFDDFFIPQVLQADELGDVAWWDQFYRYYKRSNDAPSLVFYDDKVAFKRWLLSKGVDIPRIMLLEYVSDILPVDHDQDVTDDGTIKAETLASAILQHLPTDDESDFVAKPSHMAYSMGVWVISRNGDKTRAAKEDPSSRMCGSLQNNPDFEMSNLAMSLANAILVEHKDESPTGAITAPQRKTRPGIVVEERFAELDRDEWPALEFKCFVVWGRLYVAVWRRGGWLPGFVNREGSIVTGKEVDEILSTPEHQLPDWVDWNRVVVLAEQLGTHKDFCRVDIFVGVPGAGLPSPSGGTSETEQEAGQSIRYVVSEMSSTSSELLPAPMMDEFIRLWVAGYKIGNFEVVPNTEIPSNFVVR